MLPVDDVIPFPLYHGTSTLFLDDIVRCGLGGKNPIAEWGVLGFVRELLPLVEAHLGDNPQLVQKIHSFGRMARQDVGGWNFQHGDTYLSPSSSTAIRYATNKRFGSELLTYAIDFLQELVQREMPGIRDRMYQRFPHMFRFLDISPAPILIEIPRLPYAAIAADEHGRDPAESLAKLCRHWEQDVGIFEAVGQQSNFRLARLQPVSNLKISLINVSMWRAYGSDYSLYPLQICHGDASTAS